MDLTADNDTASLALAVALDHLFLMPRKPTPPPDDPEQSKRFIETARELGTDKDPEAFERAFKTVARPKDAKAK